MLVRLTRNRRKKAGWLVALVYLLCIMAPTLSYAVPGERAVVHCMPMDGVSSTHMHDDTMRPMPLVGQAEVSSASMALSGDDTMASMSAVILDDGEDGAAPRKGPHTGGPCCALMCVSVMPTLLLDIAAPSVPTVIRIVSEYRAAADNAPDVHYRPPIA